MSISAALNWQPHLELFNSLGHNNSAYSYHLMSSFILPKQIVLYTTICTWWAPKGQICIHRL